MLFRCKYDDSHLTLRFDENDKLSLEIRVFCPAAVKNILTDVFIIIEKRNMLYTV